MNPPKSLLLRLQWESVHPEESSAQAPKIWEMILPSGTANHTGQQDPSIPNKNCSLRSAPNAHVDWACKDVLVCRNGPTATVHLPTIYKAQQAYSCHCMPLHAGLAATSLTLGHLQYKGSRRRFSSKCWCTLQKVCFLEAAKGTLAEMDASVALIPAVNYAFGILAQNSLSAL